MVTTGSQALWSFQNCVMEDLTRGEKTKDWKIMVVDSAGSGMALSVLPECTMHAVESRQWGKYKSSDGMLIV